MTTSPGLFGSARFLLPMLMVLCPVGAHASGQLPPTEIEDWELPDSGACIAQLTQIHRELLAKADPSPVPEVRRRYRPSSLQKGRSRRMQTTPFMMSNSDTRHACRFRT